MFSCLQQAGARNFFTSYSRNPERTIKCTPVDVPGSEVAVRKIPTSAPVTTIIKRQTVDTQIMLQRILLLVSSGFSVISAVESMVLLIGSESFFSY